MNELELEILNKCFIAFMGLISGALCCYGAYRRWPILMKPSEFSSPLPLDPRKIFGERGMVFILYVGGGINLFGGFFALFKALAVLFGR